MDNTLQKVLIPFVIELIVGLVAYFISLNPIVTIVALGTTLVIILVAPVVKAYYDIRQVVRIQKMLDRKKEDWLKYWIESKTVRIFLSRGAGVLGTDKDLIYQTIEKLPKDWKCEIKVLILDPNSKYISNRADDLGVSVETVKEQCRAVVRNLEYLKKRYNLENLNWAFYDDKPLLRFTLFDKSGFFVYGTGKQFLAPRDVKITNGSGSLYAALSRYFDQLWNRYFRLQE